ncbi:MAG: myo-inosose-2 dehydratase [Rhodobacter sp.]|nr:myo-inosose-2 dehydratase [Rhodobacter sp.]MCY4168805.1 myo-inosose-2 dehydratase [Rhodobacter sp.]MCY4241515.1 myo-inosose-2 dehydratase [Rhodobacter sp.]
MSNEIPVGINPLSWTNDADPELGDHISFSTCITEAALAGFTGIEIGRKFPRDPKELLAALSGRNLVPVSCWYSGFLTERDIDEEWSKAAPFVDWLVELGCKVLIYGECGAGAPQGQQAKLAQRPILGEAALASLASRLTEFGDRLLRRGMRLAFHPHVMHPVETNEEIDRLMERAGASVGLLLDTGHITMSGGDYRNIMNRHWRRTIHLHLKDVRMKILRDLDRSAVTFFESVRRGVFTLPGDGDLDFTPLFRKIADDGFDGWIVVEAEQDPRLASPGPLSQRSFRHVATLLSRCGLSCERNAYRDITEITG